MQQDQIVDAIRVSTEEVFSTMLGLEVAMGPARIEIAAPGPSDGIIAVVGLAGAWIGTVSLSCDAFTACKISSNMLGVEASEIDEDVLDAVSEIANMVVGNFKTSAETFLGALGLSIPTVVYGLSFSARSGAKEKWIVIPFDCQGNSIEVKVCLTPNRGLSRLTTHVMESTMSQV